MLDRWDDVEIHLLGLLQDDVHVGLPPVPTLAAFAGDDPVAVVALRPFGPGQLFDALTEVLALLLPLGTDRVGLATPGRAWSLDDPIPPVVDDVDLRQPVVAVTLVDAHGASPPRTDGALYPYGRDDVGGADWLPRQHLGAPEGPVTTALQHLLDRRGSVRTRSTDAAVLVQLSRCVLLGHQVALAPAVSERLERLSRQAVGPDTPRRLAR